MREDGERLQIRRVRLRTWIGSAVLPAVHHQPETDDVSRAVRSVAVARQQSVRQAEDQIGVDPVARGPKPDSSQVIPARVVPV